jgi:hypothetical protein
MVRTVVDGRDENTPHMRRVLKSQNRVFAVSKILPDKLADVFSVRNLLRKAIKSSYIDPFYNPANTVNMRLLKSAFPHEVAKVLRDLAIIINSD